MKTITIIVTEYWDKPNSNTYFSGHILVNTDKNILIVMPYELGYEYHSLNVAMGLLVERGILPEGYKTAPFYHMENNKDICINYYKIPVVRKKDMLK